MFNLSNGELSSLISSILMLGLLISSLFIRANTSNGQKLKQVAVWIAIIFFGAVFYNNRFLFKNFVPYMAADVGENKIEIQKSSDNHFYITLRVNGTRILFLVDTGATTTSLTLNDAKRVGIDTSKLTYNQIVSTANGTAYNASVEVKNIEVGDYKLDYMWVLVNKDMDGHSLLGMNFLNRLKGYEIRQDRMTLYY